MNKNKNFVLITVVIFIASLAMVGYFYFRSPDNNDASINLEPASESQKNAGETVKDKFLVEPKISSDSQSPVAEQIEIIEAYQDDAIGKIVVKTKLPGTSWKSCLLTITSPDSTTFSKSVSTIYRPDYSTCTGFAIERNEFNREGVWSLSLQATKIDGTKSNVSQDVTIN